LLFRCVANGFIQRILVQVGGERYLGSAADKWRKKTVPRRSAEQVSQDTTVPSNVPLWGNAITSSWSTWKLSYNRMKAIFSVQGLCKNGSYGFDLWRQRESQLVQPWVPPPPLSVVLLFAWAGWLFASQGRNGRMIMGKVRSSEVFE